MNKTKRFRIILGKLIITWGVCESECPGLHVYRNAARFTIESPAPTYPAPCLSFSNANADNSGDNLARDDGQGRGKASVSMMRRR